MKPLKLIMQGFGPYKNLTEIDFSLFSKSPIFLISGPTGSGKTTILDAITYALYGKTSSDLRDGKDMKSDFLDTDKDSFVELKFSVRNDVYTVKRYVKCQSKEIGVSLWKISNEKKELISSKKIRETDAIIEKIVGLNFSQFTKIIVLPQNQFSKFLLSNSSEKEEILKKLFATEIFERIEKKLEEKAKTIKEKIQNINSSIEALINSLDSQSIDEVKEKIQKAEKELEEKKSILKKLEEEFNELNEKYHRAKEITDKFNDYERKKEIYQDLKSQKENIDKLKTAVEMAEKVNSLAGYEEKLKTAREEARKANEEFISIEKKLKEMLEEQRKIEAKFNELKTKKESLKSINSRISVMEDKVPLITELIEKKSEFEKLSADLKQINEEIEKYEKLKTQLEKELENYEISVLNADKLLTEFERLKNTHKIFSKLAEKEEKINGLKKEKTSLSKEKNKLDSEKKEIKEKVEKLKEKKEKLIKEFEKGIISRLASELKDNTPCPVCGSKTHPAPAKKDFSYSTSDILDIENKLNIENQLFDEADKKLVKIESEISKIDEKIKDFEEEILREGYSYEKFKKISENIENLERNIKEVEFKKKKIPELKEKIKNTEKNLKIEEGKKHQYEKELSSLSSRIDKIKKDIGENPERFLKELNNLRKTSEELQDLIDSVQKEKENIDREVYSIKEKKENSEKRLNERIEQEENIEKNFITKIKQVGFKNIEDFEKARMTEREYKEKKKTIEDYEKKLVAAEQSYNEAYTKIKNLERPDINKIEKEKKEKEIEKNSLRDSIATIKKENDDRRKIIKTLEEKKEEISKLEKEFQLVSELSSIASGETGNRISLQRYVLSAFLEDIVIKASKRFEVMMDGRFSLRRKEDISDRRSSFGLDIEIFDNYTSTKRGVNTLSGGESFLASLALALGVSDSLTSYSGGILLESVFIDEGFGSLDPVKLENSLKVIESLTSDGRIVGIISHVEEMRMRIPSRIEVQESKSGSSVKIFI